MAFIFSQESIINMENGRLLQKAQDPVLRKRKWRQQHSIYVVEYILLCDKMKLADAEPSISDPGRLSESNTRTHMHMGNHVTNKPKH